MEVGFSACCLDRIGLGATGINGSIKLSGHNYFCPHFSVENIFKPA
jgi:hypothetical protein